MMMLTLRLGNIMLAGTTQILVMYNPTVYATADVIGTFVYREGVGSGKFSLATAIGLFESVVGFVMIMGTNYISSKVFKRGCVMRGNMTRAETIALYINYLFFLILIISMILPV